MEDVGLISREVVLDSVPMIKCCRRRYDGSVVNCVLGYVASIRLAACATAQHCCNYSFYNQPCWKFLGMR